MSGTAAPDRLGAGPVGPQALTDDGLVQRATGGDEHAFASIFGRYHQGLYRYCLALTGDSHDAQDALQNTMIKVLRALPGEQRRIELKPWLYRIAHNESVELLRRRRETRPLEDDLASTRPGLAEVATARDRLRVLIGDLDKLPERQRGVLVMRELAGLDFAEIGTALGTSPAVVRQALYEARNSLRQMDEGRAMSCEAVTRALSDGDGRVARRRDLSTHLRACGSCRRFSEEIGVREREFAALAPLPAAAAAGVLQSVLAGHGAASGSFASALGGGVAKSLGGPAVFKGFATVAVVAAIGVGAADRGGLIDAGLPGGGKARVTRAELPSVAGTAKRPSTRSRQVAGGTAAGVVASSQGSLGSAASRAMKPSAAAHPGTAGAPDDNAKLVAPGQADAGPAGPDGAAGGAGPNAGPAPEAGKTEATENSASQEAPASHPHGKGHEKQLPSASEHGQETAASHKAENHGQETAESHKAESHGAGSESHPSHPSHPPTPSHPAPSPGTEEESAAAPASPAAPESNGNAKGKGNGNKEAVPATGDDESAPAHETGKKP
jgi:RNA polymerase sigma factor (sigma-70 family)